MVEVCAGDKYVHELGLVLVGKEDEIGLKYVFMFRDGYWCLCSWWCDCLFRFLAGVTLGVTYIYYYILLYIILYYTLLSSTIQPSHLPNNNPFPLLLPFSPPIFYHPFHFSYSPLFPSPLIFLLSSFLVPIIISDPACFIGVDGWGVMCL
jgi:hypothetical protein